MYKVYKAPESLNFYISLAKTSIAYVTENIATMVWGDLRYKFVSFIQSFVTKLQEPKTIQIPNKITILLITPPTLLDEQFINALIGRFETVKTSLRMEDQEADKKLIIMHSFPPL